MEILEENNTNWLIATDTGSTTTKTKSSDLNQLLYGHDLFGLLDTGDEIWIRQATEDEPRVEIIPDEDTECYTLRIGDAPELTLGAHQKTDLVDAMAEMYREYDGETVSPIIDLYESIRENMVREEPLNKFLDVLSDKVETRDNGWFINGHVLLTFDGEFYHSNHVSRNRSGGIIGDGMSIAAYDLKVNEPTADMSRDVTVDGEQYRLTNSEMEFISKALWAIEKTPDRRDI